MRIRFIGAVLLFAASLIAASFALAQQAQTPPVDVSRELVVGTMQAPPFVIKSSDGTLRGSSIDLWRRIAEQRGIRFRFVEAGTVDELVRDTASGALDAAIAAIAVTAERARLVDFGQPYLVSHIGVAVPIDGAGAWAALRQMFFSFGFFEAVGLLVIAALLMGLILWLFERRQETGYDSKLPGLGAGIWWAASTMTQSGAKATPPRSLGGRIFAVSWMIASVVIVAVFTAALSATVTKTSLQGIVQSERDLLTARIGVPQDFAWMVYLKERNIQPQIFRDTESGFQALRTGKIDAFMNDRPQLEWTASQDRLSPVSLLDTSLGEQSLAMIFPKNSPLRGFADLALLEAVETDWWRDVLVIYGGRN